MALLLSWLGRFSARHRLSVVLVWLLVLAAAVVGSVTLSGKTSNSFSIPGQESTTALTLIGEKFGGGGSTASAQVVVRAPSGQQLTSPANSAAVERLVADLGRLPGVAAASDPLNPAAPSVNPARTTAYSTVTYRVAQGDVTAAERTALLGAVDAARSGGLTAEVTGTAVATPPDTGGVGEGVGILLALLILGLSYGSLVAAGMNLLT